MLHRLLLLALILLALLLPFELDRSWLQLGTLVLTNVEVMLWLVLTLAAAHWWQAGRPRLPVPSLWAGLLLFFLAALFLSAMLAPDFPLNAFKAAMRTVLGVALALAVSLTVQTPRHLHLLVAALVIGGLAAALVGIAELVYGGSFDWLSPLRVTPTNVGPFLRLTGSFDYANQAAMFFEATLPLLLAFCWRARMRRKRQLIFLLLLALLYAQAVILTFSRTSFITLLLVNMGLALLLALPSRFGERRLAGHAHRPFAILAASMALFMLLLIAANSLLNPVFRLRFSNGSDNDWYQVHFDVPDRLDLESGQQKRVPITVTNNGVFTWQTGGNQAINLAARWVQPESGRELSDRPHWPLPGPVAPGETVTLQVSLQAPQPEGEYRLVWDMVQENVIWFGARTGQETSSLITVSAASASERPQTPAPAAGAEEQSDLFEPRWSYQAPIPNRLTLWRAAAQLWQERPLLGVGLDNFRLLYGRPLGFEAWNPSIHSNNWLVETVVSVGLLGSLPFLLWLGLLATDLVRQLRRPDVNIWQWALAAGLMTYLVHGLLDYFLMFYATGLLFWMLVGLWLPATRKVAWQEETG